MVVRLVSHTKVRTWIVGAEENIWT